MKKLLVAAIAALGMGSLAHAEIWCGMTKHDNEVPLWTSGSHGNFATGNTLYDWCTNQINFGLCYGYVEAITDISVDQNANDICMPSGVTAREIVDVVKKYLRDYPATRHYTAASEIVSALTDAYPCDKS